MAMRLGLLLVLCALALAGGGGRSGPAIDREVATKLANQADAIAAAKDPCAARTHARILQRQTIAATNAGRVPAVFQEPLLGRVNELVSELELRCLPVPAASSPEPEPPPAPVARGPRHEPPHHEKPKHDKHHGPPHGHGRKHR
jgi:hypothetical protein